MKVLNFYGFNENKLENSDYKMLTSEEFHNEFNELIKFDKSDFEYIKNIVSDEYKVEYFKKMTQLYKVGGEFSNIAYQIILTNPHGYSYTISKKSDDWFLVQKYETKHGVYSNRIETRYICDQLTGLEHFLKGRAVTKDWKDIFKKNESVDSKIEDTLYIFDFDDTLVLNPNFEDLAIEFLKEDVSIKSLLQSSVRKIGAKLSDLKWENGKIFISDPNQEIDVKSNWVRRGKRVYLIPPDKFYFTDMSLPIDTTNLSEFYNSVENKAIVTGRPDDIKDKVKKSLDKFKLEQPNYGLHCYPAKTQTSDKVAIWKGKKIIELIKKSGFKNVKFYDDNSKWVNKVTTMVKKELPDINWSGIKYKHNHG